MAKSINNTTKNRIVFMMLMIVIIGFSVLIGRLYYLQIIEGESYQTKALSNQMRSVEISANRGDIYDRNMDELASSGTVWNVCMAPAALKESDEAQSVADENVNKIINEIAPLIDVDPQVIYEHATKTNNYYIHLKKGVDKDIADQINQFIRDNRAEYIFLEEDSSRFYQYGSLASSTLGFMGSEQQGAYGLEAYYNDLLTGEEGKISTAKNGVGTYMPYSYQQVHNTTDGNSLVLTLDQNIQHFVEKHLELAVNEHQVEERAVAIVMDVNTGEILAMSTENDYDPNSPRELYDPATLAYLETLEEDSDEYWEAYQQAQFEQWSNKAVSDPYEPGSTFKLITAAAAIDSKIVDPYTEEFLCTGSHVVGPHSIGCWKTSGHGSITFGEAVKFSCNPAFMMIGERLGGDDFYSYFDAFGFTEVTGVDMPSEASNAGLYHQPDLLNKIPGVELAVSSFGQTFKVTPIQLITAVSATVNGGYLMEPYIVKDVLDPQGNVISSTEPTVKRQVISEETSEVMRDLIESVVADSDGSGRSIAIPGYRIGGKTGTSEKTDQLVNGQVVDYVASFVGIFPMEDPQYAVLVLLDEPQMENVFGSIIAAPVVGNIIADMIDYLDIMPAESDEYMQAEDVAVPYMLGSSLSEAQTALNSKGLTPRIIGEGSEVMGQFPTGGSPVPAGGTVLIYTENQAEELMATVPNVVGMSGQEANKTITNAGFNIKLTGASILQTGVIAYSQDVMPGTEIEQGSVITIEFIDTQIEG